jgi:hypothetical protein
MTKPLHCSWILAVTGLIVRCASVQPLPNADQIKVRVLVSDIKAGPFSGQIESGGYEMRVRRRPQQERLHLCGEKVAEQVQGWARTTKRRMLKLDVASDAVLIHVYNDSPPGFFEVTYKHSSDTDATLQMYFCDTKGDEHEPQLDADELTKVTDELEKSVLCGD